MHAFVNFLRRYAILTRLIVGFACALSPLVVGFTLTQQRLGAVADTLRRGGVTDLAALAAQVDGAGALLWAALGVCSAIGVLLILAITGSVVKPIGELESATAAIAQGRLDWTPREDHGDEVGRMTRSLVRMRDALARVVGEIRLGTDSVRIASDELARGSTDLSTRTEHSAAHLQQTASTMAQIQTMAQQSASAAGRVATLTDETARIATAGEAAIDRSMATMSGLTASSRKMGDIVGVIDAIAFQTNILALNAAVEAARAGEQGRGFSVVASEVRALATRSAASAREIKDLIHTAIAEAEAGAQSVGAIRDSVGAMVGTMRDITGHIAAIHQATADQVQGIGEVTQSVAQLDTATQQNAALVEQSSAAASELQRQAAQLSQAVSVFRVAA